MAEIIMVDGKPETILKEEDLVRLVERDMGEDVARHVRSYSLRVEEMLDEVRRQEEELSDLDRCLMDLDEDRDTFRSIAGICSRGLEELEGGDRYHRLFLEAIGPALSKIKALAEGQL